MNKFLCALLGHRNIRSITTLFPADGGRPTVYFEKCLRCKEPTTTRSSSFSEDVSNVRH